MSGVSVINSKLNVELWAQDKNSVIAFFAINYALIAREKCEALRHIKDRSVFGHHFPLPDFTSWFSMYQSRKPLLAYKRFISRSSEITNKKIILMIAFRRSIRDIKRNPQKYRNLTISSQELKEALEYWENLCSETFTEIREEISKTPLDAAAQDKIKGALASDELSLGFYFLVYAPCLLLYEVSPATLYRKALQRDVTAIQKLLKLDPLILHDPAIGLQIQSVRLYGKANDYLDILNAITRQPKINYKQLSDERRSVKSDHGAEIFVLTKALNNPLEVPQIRSLYDALAADYDGTLEDTDIKSPESFDKTIRTKASTRQKQFQQTEKQK